MAAAWRYCNGPVVGSVRNRPLHHHNRHTVRDTMLQDRRIGPVAVRQADNFGQFRCRRHVAEYFVADSFRTGTCIFSFRDRTGLLHHYNRDTFRPATFQTCETGSAAVWSRNPLTAFMHGEA